MIARMGLCARSGVSQGVAIAVGLVVLAEHMLLGFRLEPGSWQQHVRSSEWALLVAFAIVTVLLFRRISAGCWVLLAGAAGNLTSWILTGAVPDYFVLVGEGRYLAFNLADLAIVAGAMMMVTRIVTKAAPARSRTAR
jgi:hypothetical protein